MPKTISKTLMVTRVAYKTVQVENGEPHFIDHTDAVFSGILEKDRVERLLKAQLGKDTMIVVTNVDAGQHRYEMDLDAFVLNARIADGEPEESSDEGADTDSGDNSDDGPDNGSVQPGATEDGSDIDPNPAADFLSDPPPISDPVPAPESAPQGDDAATDPTDVRENGGDGEDGEDEATPF